MVVYRRSYCSFDYGFDYGLSWEVWRSEIKQVRCVKKPSLSESAIYFNKRYKTSMKKWFNMVVWTTVLLLHNIMWSVKQHSKTQHLVTLRVRRLRYSECIFLVDFLFFCSSSEPFVSLLNGRVMKFLGRSSLWQGEADSITGSTIWHPNTVESNPNPILV